MYHLVETLHLYYSCTILSSFLHRMKSQGQDHSSQDLSKRLHCLQLKKLPVHPAILESILENTVFLDLDYNFWMHHSTQQKSQIGTNMFCYKCRNNKKNWILSSMFKITWKELENYPGKIRWLGKKSKRLKLLLFASCFSIKASS